MNNYIEIGDVYGYLTILEDTGKRTKGGHKIFKCRCECGNTVNRSTEAFYESLYKGCTISCGCKRDKSIGKRLAFDNNRITKSRDSMKQFDGTTIIQLQRKKLNKNNTTGFKGVSFDKKSNSYRARIQLRGKEYAKCGFKTAEAAYQYRLFLEDDYYKPIIEAYEKENKNDD